MKQSRFSSILEAIVNQIIGTLLIWIVQVIYFNLADVSISSPKHAGLIIVSMLVSMGKHYYIRRYFEGKK